MRRPSGPGAFGPKTGEEDRRPILRLRSAGRVGAGA